MSVYTESLQRLIEELAKFPGVGQRSAERFAFFVLRSSNDDVRALVQALRDVKTKIKLCSECFRMTETDPCDVCSDSRRDHAMLCVVEQPKDVVAFEKTGDYRGLYHVLLGRIAPLENSGADDLTISALLDRIRKGSFEEVILATNPTLEGEGTAIHIAGEIARIDNAIRVTRIARGIPSGSSIEFASKDILSDAIEGRKPL